MLLLTTFYSEINLQKEQISKSNPAVEAMVVLINTVSVIEKETPGCDYLESFITYLPSISSSIYSLMYSIYMYASSKELHGLHSAIVSIWIYLLDEKHTCVKDIQKRERRRREKERRREKRKSNDYHINLSRLSWFFFRLISKSMVLHLDETGKIHAENTRRDRFIDFTTQLYFLIGQIATYNKLLVAAADGNVSLAKSLNNHLAIFLSDLLDIFFDFSFRSNSTISLIPSNILLTAVKFLI